MLQKLNPNFYQWCKHKSKQLMWDEEGRSKKICYPVLCQCQIQLFAKIKSHTIIAKQKCDDQIWMNGREILQEITNNQSTPTWWIIVWSTDLIHWRRNFPKKVCPTNDLILIKNTWTWWKNKRSTSMLQKLNPNFHQWCKHKSKQPMWDEEGQPSKNLLPCLVSMPNTTIRDN